MPLSADIMGLLIAATGACGLMACLGLFYRLSATLYFLLISYFFLVEKAHYLNHMHLVCLLDALLIVVPAPRFASLDAHFGPSPHSSTVPAMRRSRPGLARSPHHRNGHRTGGYPDSPRAR